MSGWFNHSSQGSNGLARSSRLREALRAGGFVSVELNTAGWIAVLLPGVIAGAILSLFMPLSLVVGMVLGALGAWIIAVTVDRVKERHRPVGLRYDGLTAEEVAAALEEIRASDIAVTHARIEVDPWEYEHVDPAERRTHRSVFTTQNRHRRRVHDVIVAQQSDESSKHEG